MQGLQQTAPFPADTMPGNETSNAILARLPRQDFHRFSTHLTRIRLTPGQVVMEAGVPLEHVYFLESGLMTLFANGEEAAPSQLAMVGREGGLGLLELVTGSRTALATVMSQVGGTAVRAPMHNTQRAMYEITTFNDAACRAVRALMQQVMDTAACNARDTLVQRCARWLGMAHSRLDGDEVPVTHDSLASMLGVRRSGVTVATNSLQRRGLIQPGRGRIRVLDPAGLRSYANLA